MVVLQGRDVVVAHGQLGAGVDLVPGIGGEGTEASGAHTRRRLCVRATRRGVQCCRRGWEAVVKGLVEAAALCPCQELTSPGSPDSLLPLE